MAQPEKRAQDKILRSIPGEGSEGFLKDPDYLNRWYISSNSKNTLGEPFQIRLDQTAHSLMAQLIASGKTPYKTPSEFLRDWSSKGVRYVLEHGDDPELLKWAKQQAIYDEAEHQEKIFERNEKFLSQQKKKLDNSVTTAEVSKVLELCKRAEAGFEGKQLEDLEDLVKACRRRLG